MGDEVKDQAVVALRAARELDAGLVEKKMPFAEHFKRSISADRQDSYWGPGRHRPGAGYAWTGERDRALDQLEIVAKLAAGPAGPHTGILSSIRAGILCAAIRASTKSSPRSRRRTQNSKVVTVR